MRKNKGISIIYQGHLWIETMLSRSISVDLCIINLLYIDQKGFLMPAKVIDGKKVAEQIRSEVAGEVARRVAAGGSRPGLATVLVGENPASLSYVKSKQKACAEVGITSFGYEIPASTSQKDLEALVAGLNADPRVNGILVQLPLPAGFDEERVLSVISVNKDVDGFHPVNIGRLAQKGREPLFVPCTPAGVMYLLEQELPSLEGVNAVVLGRSNIVGMPVALLLVRANATVTICHSRMENLPDVVRQADVLVTAMGKAEMVRGDWVKPGAVVIDVGINHVDDASRPRGYRLVGDVAYDEVAQVAGAITPVPGGVGPMTIAMLLRSTLHAAEIAQS
jgi:5,10-methylene-tetrahydrofolate dehydrogenase/methenyl tetrahydrofolate cyclohydrolase